jgi:oligopeptide transport system substrate-binding protein
LMGGLVTVADTLAAPSDPVYRLVEQRGLRRYPFDLREAERLMAEAGWTKPAGGVYRSASEELFPMDITFSDSVENTQEATAVAGQWKAAGVGEVTLSGIATTLPTAVRNQARHTGKGVAAFPRGGPDLTAVKDFISSETGTAANRYTTGNRGGYSNPEYDRLYDRARVTLDVGQRQALVADMLRILAEDVGTIAGFYDSSTATAAFRTGVRGPAPTSPLQLNASTWNMHEWDRD